MQRIHYTTIIILNYYYLLPIEFYFYTVRTLSHSIGTNYTPSRSSNWTITICNIDYRYVLPACTTVSMFHNQLVSWAQWSVTPNNPYTLRVTYWYALDPYIGRACVMDPCPIRFRKFSNAEIFLSWLFVCIPNIILTIFFFCYYYLQTKCIA